MLIGTPIKSNSQELKTYTGAFPEFGEGTATYQYREAPDGSHSLEGEFTFVRKGRNSLKVSGQFKNDRQVGVWNFQQIVGIDSPDNNSTEITFINLGCRVVHKYGRYGENTIKAKITWPSEIGVYYESGAFRKSNIFSCLIVDSLYYWDARSGLMAEGTSNSKGVPIGKWRVREDAKHPYMMKEIVINQFGGHTNKQWYYIDDTTGDRKTDDYGDVPYRIIDKTVAEAKNVAYNRIIRSTFPIVKHYK